MSESAGETNSGFHGALHCYKEKEDYQYIFKRQNEGIGYAIRIFSNDQQQTHTRTKL